jgi:tRNA U34 5-methylaminomethyl-2-thiouridine-forming methyltransferase MnmC
MTEHRPWTPLRTGDGSWTLVHPVHGAACHSQAGAWQQARERYALPCRLRELAQSQSAIELLDIGTGLGLNLAAALEALSGTSAELHATSLERDTDVIRSALALTDWPPEVERHYAPVRDALARCLTERTTSTRVPLGSRGSLTLHLGDALAELRASPAGARFDAVFLDPFAPTVEPALWDREFLGLVAARMRPHAVLSTYSASLAVRVALAGSGLGVGRGPRVGLKSAGTLASFEAALPPLEARTERRLARRSEADVARRQKN